VESRLSPIVLRAVSNSLSSTLRVEVLSFYGDYKGRSISLRLCLMAVG